MTKIGSSANSARSRSFKIQDGEMTSLQLVGTLQSWKTQQTKASILTSPEVSVNGQVFEGSVEAENVFKMICESLENNV